MPIDYDFIKENLSIKQVLKEYGYLRHLKINGNKLYGSCPIHNGDNPRAFNVTQDKNLWNCFTRCGGGSVLDLIMKIEKVGVKQAAQIGYGLLGIKNDSDNKSKKCKPLDFKLSLDPDHPYLHRRGVNPETASYFGIGYCDQGIMKGRIAIPIHDRKNNLVAYCGRAIHDKSTKYRFPKGFEKSQIVYNLNRSMKSKAEEIAVVEGFFDVYALFRAGINAVALMGSHMSYYQKKQLSDLEKRLVLMLDGDNAGRNGMAKLVDALERKKPLKAIYLPKGVQPDTLNTVKIHSLFNIGLQTEH